MTSPTQPEEHHVPGGQLLARAKDLIHEGNVRRLIVKNEQGHTVIEIPLTIGVVGAVLAPVWAALGAIAALAGHYTLVVERRSPQDAAAPTAAIPADTRPSGDAGPSADAPR
jgi:uncharacterized protein DUF4342